jgi:hypothetical protein
MTVDTLGPPQAIARWVNLLGPARQLAEVLSMTEFVPTAMRGKPDAIAAAILYGDELGIEPMQALASIHVVEGRPAPSAELMRALILRAGHSFVVHEMSGTRVRVSGLRHGRPEAERTVVDWSLDMARSAGLLGRKNWQNYPRAMLMARATGDLARVVFPDVVKGLGYIAEDTDDARVMESWGPPEAIGQDGPKKAIQRTRRPKAAPAPADEPADAPEAPSEPRAHDETPPPVAPVPTPREVVSENNDRPVEEVTLPELAPEQTPDEQPATGPATISAAPLKALHTALGKELGSVATREEKLAMLSAILNRPVLSSKDLTRAEGYEVLDVLGQMAEGTVTWQMDPEFGGITVDRPSQ